MDNRFWISDALIGDKTGDANLEHILCKLPEYGDAVAVAASGLPLALLQVAGDVFICNENRSAAGVRPVSVKLGQEICFVIVFIAQAAF